METYFARIIELFKSGAATPEQWSAMAECVIVASEYGVAEAKGLEDAIGFTAQQGAYFAEEDARVLAV